MEILDKDILIVGSQEFVAPYIYRELEKHISSNARLWLMGTGPLAGINFDLSYGVVSLPAKMDTVIYCDSIDSRVKSYTSETAMCAVGNLVKSFSNSVPSNMVYISTVDVYGIEEGDLITEELTPKPVDRFAMAKFDVEIFLTRWCKEHGVSLAILRPAHIVGTGMGGDLRILVNRIYRGSYRHIAGNDSRVSVVHAESLAKAVAKTIGLNGIWNVTDGVDPTRFDLAEALSWRMGNKRIYTLKSREARIIARVNDYISLFWLDRAALKRELTTLTFSSAKLRDEVGFIPQPVVDFLRTHDYNEQSL